VSFAAGHGPAIRGTSGRLTATSFRRTTGSTNWASGSHGRLRLIRQSSCPYLWGLGRYSGLSSYRASPFLKRQKTSPATVKTWMRRCSKSFPATVPTKRKDRTSKSNNQVTVSPQKQGNRWSRKRRQSIPDLKSRVLWQWQIFSSTIVLEMGRTDDWNHQRQGALLRLRMRCDDGGQATTIIEGFESKDMNSPCIVRSCVGICE